MNIVIALLMVFFSASTGFAYLPLVGRGEKLEVKPGVLPQEMKPNYELLKSKCTKCHSLERVLVSVKAGRWIISNSRIYYGRSTTDSASIDKKLNAMKEKPESNISEQDVPILKSLMDWMAAKEKEN